MKSLSENTLIPIGLAVIVIGGGAAWLTDLHSSIAATEARVSKVEPKVDKVSDDIAEIKQSIAVILERLPVKK